MTLAASALNYATVWLDILVVPHLAGSILNTYIAIGRTGEFCSIALFASALAGTGTARVYAVLAAAGLLFMWMRHRILLFLTAKSPETGLSSTGELVLHVRESDSSRVDSARAATVAEAAMSVVQEGCSSEGIQAHPVCRAS